MCAKASNLLVDRASDFDQQLHKIRQAGRFAFDTEFVGEDRYKPELCLIQIATETTQILIDPLAGLDCRSFWELVADPSVEKIVHAGSEDLAICSQQIGRQAANVLDVQIAAGLIGLGYPTSLGRADCRRTDRPWLSNQPCPAHSGDDRRKAAQVTNA